ncbi:MAG: MerR family transcriptional regulator [Burkholderiales bacterium]|nr:MerR family transcriptional regulator [Burkholderiales bacterium]
MNDRNATPSLSRTIAAVERDTGLSKDTLRVWERRYGFPHPDRDQFGERVYPIEQVDKLRVLRRLMDAGHRPGKVIHLPIEQLQALAAETTASSVIPRSMGDANAEHEDLQRYLELIKAHEVDSLRRALSQAQLRIGMERFVTEIVSPLTRMVGDAWARGYVEVFEEHLYTESIQVVLRGAIGTIPQPARRPRILLTTIPQEPHGLGLLMAEAILALEGCRCVSLGVQTPIWDIVLASSAHRADVVALSFSAVVNPNQVLDSLVELRQKLPAGTEIWAGGNCPILQRRPPADITVLNELIEIQPTIRRWREAHPEG